MSNDPFYLVNNKALLSADASDDLLHSEENASVKGDSATETQYFGFNVPEAKIHGLCYMWHHPNLGVVTGGVMAWRGVKRMALAAELFDFRAYMNDSALQNDLHEYRLDNGYGVKILEPNKRFHITYKDEARQNEVDLVSEAITPVVMFGDRKHFEQGMRVRGKLVLRGEECDVDCFNVRDRSWGKLRPEDVMSMPPVSWMTGTLSENFIFNCTMMDHAGGNPLCVENFAIPADKALSGGWIWNDGNLSRIVRAEKQVVRTPGSHTPSEIRLSMTAEDDRSYVVVGKMAASCPWAAWPNMMCNISLIQWTWNDLTGHGDCQDVLWNDYVLAAERRSTSGTGGTA